ncbi:MAG: glycosyltransferase [Gemmataceae bacterium]|nr:glycosyltransferase [Gemmataceae bacterium]
MPTFLAVIFWVCLTLVVFAYAIYPVLIFVFSRAFGRPNVPGVGASGGPTTDADLPTLTLLIAAHNEEADIEQRILNALALDYPAGKLEIVIASDGSTDATNAIVRRYEHRGVRLLAYAVNRGKAAVLDTSVPQSSGQVVLLSDANTHM